jgi:hypothetical protein
LADVGSGLVPREADSDQFEYSRWRLIYTILVLTIAAAFLLAVAFGWRSTGSFLSSVFIVVVAAHAIFYVARRITNPVAFVASDRNVRAIYWTGTARDWPIETLRIRTTRAPFWDSSIVVSENATGRTAFRVFRDLPKFRGLCGKLGVNPAAV